LGYVHEILRKEAWGREEVSYICSKDNPGVLEMRSNVIGESIFMLLIFHTAAGRRLFLSMGAAS